MVNSADARRAAAPIEPVTRRRFLKGAMIGSAAVVGLAAGGFAWLRRSPLDGLPRPDHLANLSQGEYHLFNRAISVLLPLQDTNLTPLDQVPVIENINHMISLLPAHLRKDVGTGLALFDNAAVLSGWHGRRFVDLTDADAVAYFDAWSRGGTIQRALASLIKQFVYVSYWREPATWPPVHFDGPVSDDWGIAYLGNAPLPAEDQPAGENA